MSRQQSVSDLEVMRSTGLILNRYINETKDSIIIFYVKPFFGF